MRLNDPKGDQFRGLKRFPRNLAAGSPLGYTSVSKGQTQFIGLLSLLVEGSGVVTGLWKVDGELRVGGTLNGSGTMNWTGPANISGNFEILSGGLFKAGNLTITPGGTITGASGLIINPNGQLAVTGDVYVQNDLDVDGGLTVAGAKSFRMAHPVKDGYWLQHGSTESPVSGIEYWGESLIPASGKCIVKLPAYFEALAKPEGRTVFVSGRGVAADWDDISDGKFVVRGTAGKKFSWLVKAERFGGDFPVESLVEQSRSIELGTVTGNGDPDDSGVVGEVSP